ncbi:restriction endonuclease [Trichocoleus sp. Lan]|uniref:nSTAND3 domain-containing NTPase n=1 Tax=Trichocoleus sp. Lan TaxID=2933927 RepID=UPI00329913BC
MPDYDFKGLSPFDFECLVRDLLQQELNCSLESFTSGRDDGIDLRHSRDAAKSFVVQCKHFAGSSYANLISRLRRLELPKVQKLVPRRYILATSLGLTPRNKKEIQELFKPFILSPQDIYSREDINALLSKFPSIEKAHFKLYLTSIPVLERILHAGLFNRSKQRILEAQSKARVYVQNETFQQAYKILEDQHVCIITGIPGIGKTSLAEMLILHYLTLGYEPIDISSDVAEADPVLSDLGRKIFLFDDFLGQTSIVEKLSQNADDRLVRFARWVMQSPDKRFILTTREYILAQARTMYEKLDRFKIEPMKCILDIAAYAPLARAEILYNHLYFANLPEDWKATIAEEHAYKKIIYHLNYNPRLIEGIVEFARTKCSEPSEFYRFFLDILDHPRHLWQHPFERQLNDEMRNLILLIVTLPTELDVQDLKSCFSSFIAQDVTSKTWEDALRILEGTFLSFDTFLIRGVKASKMQVVRLHNPSLRDFLLDYLDEHSGFISQILTRAKFFYQCEILWLYATGTRRIWAKQEQRLGIHESLRAKSGLLIDALIRTFESPECQLVTIGGEGQNYKYKKTVSLESRLASVIDVVCELECEEQGIWLREMMSKITRSWNAGEGHKRGTLSLLHSLIKVKIWDTEEREAILKAAARWYVTSLDDMYDYDDYDSLRLFAKDFLPIFESVRSLANLSLLEKWIEGQTYFIKWYAEDSDTAQDTLNDTLEVANLFRLKVSDELLNSLEERIAELKEAEKEQSKLRQRKDAAQAGASLSNRAEIDALFDLLRIEISSVNKRD